MKDLEQRNQKIVTMYQEGKSPKEISRAVGLGYLRVRQILRAAGVLPVREYGTPGRPPKIENAQEVLYKFICDYMKKNGGNPPSYQAMMEETGIPSSGSVRQSLNRLVEEGKVRLKPGEKYIQIVGSEWLSPEEVVKYRMTQELIHLSKPGSDRLSVGA